MTATTSRECLQPDEVAAFVDQAVPDDRRREIEAHLDGCDGCRRWVSAVASDGAPTSSESGEARPRAEAVDLQVEVGAAVGRYTLLRRIGAGGMGVVAKAYDPELDRHVAIKLLRAEVGASNDPDRVLREARAMARVKHPNVVPVFDVGLHDGHLFIAMEFVEGEHFGAWLRGGSRSVREILQLACAAGRGIEAAHDAGLVHRDLKPANILVGPHGRPQVADFGLARLGALDAGATAPGRAGLTFEQTHLAAGTLGFMAPEQYDGAPVDARADQFGFCATVHFALHGVLPYPGKTVAEISGAIAQGRLAASGRAVPRRVRRALRRGLSTDRQARFASMSALLAELTPRSARQRWLQVGGAASVFAAGVFVRQALGGDATDCTIGTTLVRSAWSDAHRQRIAQAFAATELSYADTALANTTATLDAHATAWTQAHALACRAHVDGRASETLTDVRMQCLDHQVLALGAWTNRLAEADRPMVEAVTEGLARLEAPQSCLDREPARGPTPPSADQRADVDEARRHLVEARTLLQTGATEPASEAVQMARVATERADYEPLDAELALVEGRVLDGAGKRNHALQRLEDAAVEAEAIGDDRLVIRARRHLLDATAADASRLPETVRLARLLDAALRRAGPVSHVDSAALDRAVGRAYNVAHEPRKALVHYQAAAEKLADTPGLDRALSRYGMASALLADYRVEEARRQLDQACPEYAERLGSAHPRTLQCSAAIASAQLAGGEIAEARDRLQAIRSAEIEQLGPDALAVTTTERNLVISLQLLGEFEAALPLAEHVASVRAEVMGNDSFAAATGLNTVATVQRGLGDYEAAIATLGRALAMTIAAVGPDNRAVAEVQQSIGLTYLEDDQPQRAYEAFAEELRIMQRNVGEHHVDVMAPLTNIGAAMQAQGRHAEALAHHERALAIANAELPGDGRASTGIRRAMGAAQLALGRPQQAITSFQAALARVGDEPHRAAARADLELVLAQAALSLTPPDRALAAEALGRARTIATRLDDAELLARAAAMRKAESAP